MITRRHMTCAVLLALLVSSIPLSRASADHIWDGPRHAVTPDQVAVTLAVMPIRSPGTTPATLQ